MSRGPGLLGEPRQRRWVVAPTVLALLIAGAQASLLRAEEEKQLINPFAGDPAAAREGKALFVFCGACHGLDAQGGAKGPDLTSRRFIHGDSDAAIFRTISQGIPGTEMPTSFFNEVENWKILAYLRTLSPTSSALPSGNEASGEKIFWGKGLCSNCHMVKGKGGRLGPDLSRVGSSRSARYITESIREPDKHLTEGIVEPNKGYPSFPPVYATVSVVTRDGRRITGVPKNEDNFSIQLMDQREQLHLLLKKDLRELITERKSLMPAYNEQMLNEEELRDLLAYLAGLGGR